MNTVYALIIVLSSGREVPVTTYPTQAACEGIAAMALSHNARAMGARQYLTEMQQRKHPEQLPPPPVEQITSATCEGRTQ